MYLVEVNSGFAAVVECHQTISYSAHCVAAVRDQSVQGCLQTTKVDSHCSQFLCRTHAIVLLSYSLSKEDLDGRSCSVAQE
jgi:hypothetical protein